MNRHVQYYNVYMFGRNIYGACSSCNIQFLLPLTGWHILGKHNLFPISYEINFYI
jgi:hypothetical protein